MSTETLTLPTVQLVKRHILSSLQRYWTNNEEAIDALPVNRESIHPDIQLPLKLCEVHLPNWARDCGIDGILLIPEELLPQGKTSADQDLWQEIDWFLVAFLMLEAWHERMWEVKHGPIHSYSFRLRGWDERIWERAWVNRIALFLREWAAHDKGVKAETIFGTLPACNILMTHDVDAVSKTVSIRLKQGAFNLFNSVRAMVKGNLRVGIAHLMQAIRFLFGVENWWTLDRLVEWERNAGIRSHFNFFFDRRHKTFMRWLLDPGYDISSPQLSRFIKKIHEGGWVVGLHPTFDAWQDPMLIRAQRKGVESILGSEVKTCRQHWLRFAWASTWAAQSQAGIHLDTTLMFNDRPGFRAAVAMNWAPWNPTTACAHNMAVLPTVLMDSHLYDYQQMTASERRTSIRAWLGEVHAVGGEIAVVWHPHTLTDDYGWTDGFMELVDTMSGRTIC